MVASCPKGKSQKFENVASVVSAFKFHGIFPHELLEMKAEEEIRRVLEKMEASKYDTYETSSYMEALRWVLDEGGQDWSD